MQVNDLVLAGAVVPEGAVVLAAGESQHTDSLVSFAIIMGVALLAPLLSYMVRWKVPAVALLLVLGMVIGPSVLDIAQVDTGISLIKELGMGALFLLAGFEIQLASLSSKEARTATSTWILCMIASVVGAYFLLDDGIHLAIVLGIAVTSTALGTITPMLKQNGLMAGKVGKSVMIHGAIGEVMPITAMALLLSARATWQTGLILLAFLAITVLLAVTPKAVARLMPLVKEAFLEGAASTNQTIMRLILLMLAILMAVAAVFELDIVLGAFATGILLNQIIPDEYHERLEHRLDVLCYSFLIPVFFVCSGMALDWSVIRSEPFLVLTVPLLILVTRGLPVFLRENVHHTGSDIETVRERAQVALYSATGLPIIVAVMAIAQNSGIVTNEQASIFIAGGALTVLIFPLVAGFVGENPEIEAAEPPKQSLSDL